MSSVQKRPMEGRIAGKRYRIGRLMRRSPSGNVYACHDLVEENRCLSIRILPFLKLREPSESLGRRIVLLKKLQHPQIENICDFGSMSETGGLFLVSALTEGADIYSGTENSDLSEILTLFAGILSALKYPHVRGLIHGNLTSQSVMLFKNPEGRSVPLLRDFSLPLFAERTGGFRNCEPICYTAPELLLEEREGKEADFYALGIMLYQLLMRRLPFENGDPDFVIQKQIQGIIDLDPVARLDGGESVVPLLERLLEKNPEKRIRSADEALALLPPQTRHDWNLPEEADGRFSAAPFVEREKEMRLLRECVRQVNESGRGRAVFIAGEAGSGKKRCMEELRGWAVVNGWRVEECVFSARDENPYAPYMRILGKNLEARASRLPGRRTGSAEKPEYHAIGDDEKEMGSFSEDISLVAEAGSSIYGFASGRLQDRLARELVRRFSGRPTLVLLHDIHFAAEQARTVLEYLCADIRGRPILLCAGFHADEISGDDIGRLISGALRGGRGEVVSLDPLTKNGVRQIIAGLTGNYKHNEILCGRLFRAVGGNPYFLKEMLKHLAKHGILRNQPGGWKLTRELLPKSEVPAGIGRILRERIARLSPAAMETLKWLSLFHQPVPRKYTELLTGFDRKTAEASIAELGRRRLLLTDSQAGEERVAAGYELIAEVAREMIPPERKRKMYRNIAELLEKEAGKERLHEAALHYIESPPDDYSVQRALTAITGFKAAFAHENALRCFEYVFKYKNKLTAKEILQSLIATCDSMFALGEARQAIRLINSALRSHSGVDPELKARLYLCLATAYRYSGDWRLQEQSCQAGLRTLRASPGAGRFAETMLWTELAFSAVLRSRVRNALHCLDRAMEVCPDGTSSALSGKIQYLHAILYCAGGELKKSIGASERAIAVLGHTGDHMQKCYALSMLGLVHMKRGRLTTALRLHLRAAAMGKKSGNVVQRGWTGGKLAECICRTGQVRKAFTAIAYSAAAAKESNNTAIRRACDTTEAEINLFACNYRETRRILKTLQGGEKQDILDFTAGRAGYVSANLNFRLGDFESALDDIRKICENKTSGDQYYEYDLAEALRERILFERDNDTGSLERLRILESRVAQKSLLFQRCIIMLHICEVSIRMKKTDEAEACARNMLRLAKGMRTASMQCRAYLMLGISRSPLQRAFFSDAHAVMDADDADKAIYSLNACLNLAEAACSLECQWKALAELSFIYRIRKNYELCFHCAQKAHETLVKLEEQTPSDMMDSFHKAFGRGRIKQELAYLIETEQSFYRNTHAVKWSKNANGGILLQMTELVNSVREIPLLLDGLLALALPKIAVRRGMIFLLDEITGKLELAGQRGDKNDNMIFEGNVHRAILESVCREGKPLISSDAGSDPRITKIIFKELPGKLLCIPLKAFGRTIGVFYADSFKPVENISESEIDLAEAFCGLTALAVDNILAHRKLTDASAKPDLTETPDLFPEIIGASPAARLLKDHIRRAADSPLDVLITGESGSGKELVARAIRNGGVGRNGKFIPVDCGTLSDGIAETELFGCRKGAFTGATEDRAGLFEAASGGVLFLDEISNMPLHMQAKLLRVLQEREIRRIGETFPRKIELRVVAATNRNLAEDIKNGRFRNDLFHRLKGMEIYIPPLSERAEDIPLLAGHFLQGISDQGKGEIRRFSPEAMKLLQRYSYPGNIRELKNIVESAYYSSSGNVIEAGAFPPEVRVLNITKTVYDSVSAAENLYRRILAGEENFDDLVKKPYLDRCLDASVVRGVIQLALSDSSGIYKDAFTRLRIPKKRYSAMMQFLKRRGCYLDFLPFRRDCE